MVISESVLHALCNPFYHFAACNMCSFPVSHCTNILVSFCLQHHGPTILLSSCALLLSHPRSSHEPSACLCTCLREGHWSQSHKSSDTYVFPVKWPSIFPRTQSLAKGLASVGQPTSHPLSSEAPVLPKVWPQEIYPFSKSIRDNITKTGANKCCIFEDLTVSL